MADISCPECKKQDPSRAIDKVQKVSAVAGNGTPVGQSLIFPVLSPPVISPHLPSRPIEPQPLGKDTEKGLGCIFAFGGGFLVVGIGTLLGIHAGPIGGWAIFIAGMIVGIVVLVFITNWHPIYNQEVRRWEEECEPIRARAAEEHTKALEQYNQLLPHYQRLRSVWNELYYCHIHDEVFLPDGRSPLVPRKEDGSHIWAFWGMP